MLMHALAASCEELRARTGNPPLQDFILWFRIKNVLDCHRIWLTLDGEERDVAQRSLQFVSDSMEVNINANFSLISSRLLLGIHK